MPALGPVLALGTALVRGASNAWFFEFQDPVGLKSGAWVAIGLCAALAVVSLLAIWSYRERSGARVSAEA